MNETTSKEKYGELEKVLPKGEVLYPGSKAYQKAIFIGNLMYRFKSPACVVMAETDEDVQTTVRFAKKNKMKLNVKNGGHSYAGFCLNEGGIVLDMSRMKAVSIDGMTITMQGGLLWRDAYKLLKDDNINNIIIGGQCPTVGVSGFTLGGGLSPFSRSYGLAIDGLLEMTIVTADGEILTVTEHETDPHKKDLFWAIRGGGGGNFGITTNIKAKIYRLNNPKVVCGELSWNIPAQEEDFKKAMNAFNTMDCPNELTIDAIWRFDANNNLLAQMTVIYNGTMKQCHDALATILAYNPSNELKEMHWTEWEKEEEGFDVFSKIYHHHTSFVFGIGSITPEVTNKIFELIAESPALVTNSDPTKAKQNKCHILWDHIGGAASKVPATDTAYYWRDGVYVMTVKVQWSSPEQQAEAYAFSQKCKDVLSEYSLDGKASYLNYLDASLENWQEAYYGDNYNRLREIKTYWDPSNFFYFKQSIELTDKHRPSQIWQNWGQCVTATPSEFYRPTNENEIIKIVTKAREYGKTIRIVGSGHTWSPLVPTKDIFISMENFTTIEVAKDKKSVTIGSGVTVDELSAVLIANDICFESNVGHGVGEATYGGIVSTGCHGSGITFKSTSDLAIAIEVITSNGTFKTFTPKDGDIMNAARLSLGMFGIITKITFEVKPAFNVKVEEFKYPLDKCLEEIEAFVLDNDYAEVTWIPFNDQVYMQKANRTTEIASRNGAAPDLSDFDITLNKAIAATTLSALNTDPTQTPDIMRTGFRILPLYNYVSNITDYLHNSDYHAILAYRVSDIEIAIEIDEGFNSVRKAILLTQQRVTEWQKAGLFPFNGALGFRFIKNSDATLSQARGNKYTALVEFISYYKTDLFEKFSGELIQDLIDELPNARPHWAKGFQFMPETVKYVKQSFGSQIDEFNDLKNKAGVDPHDMFVNSFLKSIFKSGKMES